MNSATVIQHIKNILLVAVIFTVVDIGFLRYMMKYWDTQLKNIQGSGLKMDSVAAGLAYVVLVTGLYYFIMLDGKTPIQAAILGWLIYLTYEFTNKAIFSNWSWRTVLMDGLWGGILFGLTTWLYYFIKQKFAL
jgi:uncharacterized membrane protein